MVQRTVAWILGRCGDGVTLCDLDGGNRRSVRAVVQPITQNSDEKKLPTAVGRMDEGRYLYLGLPQHPIEARRDVVLWNGRCFAVMNAHPIYVGGRISHWWGVLEEKEGAL